MYAYVRSIASQFAAYVDVSATAGTQGSSVGIIATCRYVASVMQQA